MRRAKDEKRSVNIFSNIHVTLNFNGKSKAGTIVSCAMAIAIILVAIVLAAKLLAMSFSDTDTLMYWLSSLLSALGC